MTTSRQKIGLMLIAGLALARFIIVPWFAWVDTKVESIQALNQNKERFQSIRYKNMQLTDQEQLIASGYKQISQMWYQGDVSQSSVKILQHIEALAKTHKVELSTRQTGQASNAEGVSTMPASLFVKGKPQDIYSFLAAVESNQPISVVQNLRLTRINAVSKDMTALIDMSIVLKPEGVSK